MDTQQLRHVTPGGVGLTQILTRPSPGPHIVLAFPVDARVGESSEKAAELSRLAPQFKLAPYTPVAAALPESWPYGVRTYVELAHLAEEHAADAIVQLDPESDMLSWPCILALARPVLSDRIGFSTASYQMNRYSGLLNSAALRPLTRAIYGADLSYPLAPDIAYSRAFLKHLASSAPNDRTASSGDLLLWPALEAVTQAVGIAQVAVGVRHLSDRQNPDVNALLAQILSSMFAEIEQSASFWQRSRPVYPRPEFERVRFHRTDFGSTESKRHPAS